MLILGDELNITSLTTRRCLGLGLERERGAVCSIKSTTTDLIENFEKDRESAVRIDATDLPSIRAPHAEFGLRDIRCTLRERDTAANGSTHLQFATCLEERSTFIHRVS